MKAIKINIENAAAITAALKAVNGKAEAHAYTSYYEIVELTANADAELARIGLPRSMHTGAEYRALSGEKVSGTYAKKARTRAATRVCLERRSTGWFLTSIQAAEVWQEGGNQRLVITTEQQTEALRRFSASLFVAA